MLKWLLTLFVVLAVLALIAPGAGPGLSAKSSRWGLGRLPGDFQIPARGRIYYIPFASTVVLSLLVWLLSKVI